MKTLVGIFSSPTDAGRAYSDLRSLNLHGEDLIVLTPEASLQQIDAVPTEDGEQPGMGKALGGVIGGAMGLAAGAAVASLLLPGVGAVLAIGLGAGTLGLGGAIAGAAGGGALEEGLTQGLPKDEIFLYEEALRQGRTVIVVTSEDDDLLTQSRQLMERNGAESLDAAREKWWIGLRDTDAADYDAPQEARNEPLYRSGFQAALEPDLRGKPLQDGRSILKERFPHLSGRVVSTGLRGSPGILFELAQERADSSSDVIAGESEPSAWLGSEHNILATFLSSTR